VISVQIDNKDVIAALLRAPISVKAHVSLKLGRAAKEVAREARRVAPKAFTTLAQTIKDSRIAQLEFHVTPGVNYARSVEEGSRPGKMPNPDALRPWVERVLGVRGHEAKNKAFLVARSIARHGTRAQPFMAPTAIKMESRVMQLVREGVVDGLNAAGLA
jgi:hypothetical protein